LGAPTATRTFSGDHPAVMPREITRGISRPYGASVPPRTRRRRGHIEPLPSGHFRAVVFAPRTPARTTVRIVRSATTPDRGSAAGPSAALGSWCGGPGTVAGPRRRGTI
jgi:hypothetical protein